MKIIAATVAKVTNTELVEMKLRKFLAVASVSAIILGGAQSGALAQDLTDSHLSAARDAISSITATDRFDNILPNVAQAIKQQLIANNPDLEVQINDVVDSETIAMVSRRGDLEREAARIYAQAISEEHLLEIAAFYATDAGQELLKNGAIVGREVQAAAGIWQRGVERDLLENVSKKLGEIAPRAPADTTEEGADAPAAE